METVKPKFAPPAPPRWTYSTYRAALRIDGKTVALLSPDGRNAFDQNQVKLLLETLNSMSDATANVISAQLKAEQPG